MYEYCYVCILLRMNIVMLW